MHAGITMQQVCTKVAYNMLEFARHFLLCPWFPVSKFIFNRKRSKGLRHNPRC